MSLIKSKETLVWLILASMTLVSWLLGNKYNVINPEHIKLMTLVVIALAFFKVRLVIMHFMEIGHAPLPLRAVFEVWVVGLCLGVAWFYVISPV